MTVCCAKQTSNLLKSVTKASRYRRSYSTQDPPNFVKIFEQAPRDGLQNESKAISVDTKVELINRLVGCGIKQIEGGAFVSPKWVPQMAGTADVLKKLPQRSDLSYPCLIPNEKAVELFFASDSDKYCDQVGLFLACSESFNKANLNRTIAQSLDICARTAELLKQKNMPFRAGASTVIACPFDGPTDPAKVREIAKQLYDMGAYEIMLGDTIGVGVPSSIERVINEVVKSVPIERLALHCHDTYGSGVANVLRAVEVGFRLVCAAGFDPSQMGIRTIDSSIGGTGGCPYAPGATGNVSTEDVVYALHEEGYETGIDLFKAAETGQWLSDVLGRKNSARAGPGLLGKARKKQGTPRLAT